MDKETIILGSGDLYTVEFAGAIPADEEIEKEENKLGYVKNGCSIEYKSEYYTAKDDKGIVDKTKLTTEEVTLKSGIITPCELFDKICNTARKSKTGKRTTYKIGGLKSQNGKRYVVRFVYKDEEDGDIRVTIVGNNQTGFTLAFAIDQETIVDVEFKALAADKEGTLLIFDMDEPAGSSEPSPTPQSE